MIVTNMFISAFKRRMYSKTASQLCNIWNWMSAEQAAKNGDLLSLPYTTLFEYLQVVFLKRCTLVAFPICVLEF